MNYVDVGAQYALMEHAPVVGDSANIAEALGGNTTKTAWKSQEALTVTAKMTAMEVASLNRPGSRGRVAKGGGKGSMSEALVTDIQNAYFAVEDVLRHEREQRESVSGKDTPFRVEFRFSQGTRHYQYFPTYKDCLTATSAAPSYGPTGRAHIEHPRSQQIQFRGPRGGWKKYQITS